jgi:hypothetical protein
VVGNANAHLESVVDRAREPAEHPDQHADSQQLTDRSIVMDRRLRASPHEPSSAIRVSPSAT